MSETWIEIGNGYATGWAAAIWRASWQGAITAGLVWLVCLALRKLPYALRCGLWWLVCLKMLLALSPTSVPVPMLSARVVPQSSELAVQTQISPDFGVVESLPLSFVEASRRPVGVPPSWELGLFGLWGVGVLWFGLLALRPLSLTRAVVRRAKMCDDAALISEGEDVARRIGLRSVPRILISEESEDVLTFGIFRPIVLLSRQTLDACSPEERRMILAHEFAHVRRSDAWLALVPQLAQVVFFFHPLVWLASREFNFSREAECDQTAIRSMQVGPEHYGRLLLRLGATQGRGQALCSPGVSSHFHVLRRRIAMLELVSNCNIFRPRRGVLAMLGLTALLCVAPISLVQGQSTTPAGTPVSKKSAAPMPSAGTGIALVRHSLKHSKIAVKRANLPKVAANLVPKAGSPVALEKVNGNAQPGQPRSTSVFTLQYAKASSTAALLKQLFKSSEVAIAPDERTNQIVARGSKAILAEVTSVVTNLDQPSPSDEKQEATRQIRVFSLKYARASDMADIIRNSIAGKRSASVSADLRTNSVVVTADPTQMDRIFRLVADLDKLSDQQSAIEHAVTRVIPVRNRKADEMLNLIHGMLHFNDLLFISIDPNTNNIIVKASENTINEIQVLVSQFDVPKSK
jgi:beta-lactamase regulating signal transducer with metallopeptidase domain